jgi:hypothetical protein
VLARHFPFPLALACWLSILLPRWWLQELATRALHRSLARWRPPALALLLGGACLGAVLCQPYALWVAGWFQDTFSHFVPAAAGTPARWSWSAYADRFWATLPLQLLAVAPWVAANLVCDRWMGRQRFGYVLPGVGAPGPSRLEQASPAPSSPEQGPAESSAARPAFAAKLRRVPVDEILAVEAADHFIRVYGRGASEMIYCQFGDALEELAHLDGLRVHRSWWVARTAIAGAARTKGRSSLQLVNGTRVPVGRRFLSQVRAATVAWRPSTPDRAVAAAAGVRDAHAAGR